VRVFGVRDPSKRSSVVLFDIEGMDPAAVGDALDSDYEIAARVGLHCAPDAHKTIGTYPTGGVRLSPGYFNTEDDVDATLEAVRAISAGCLENSLVRRMQ